MCIYYDRIFRILLVLNMSKLCCIICLSSFIFAISAYAIKQDHTLNELKKSLQQKRNNNYKINEIQEIDLLMQKLENLERNRCVLAIKIQRKLSNNTVSKNITAKKLMILLKQKNVDKNFSKKNMEKTKKSINILEKIEYECTQLKEQIQKKLQDIEVIELDQTVLTNGKTKQNSIVEELKKDLQQRRDIDNFSMDDLTEIEELIEELEKTETGSAEFKKLQKLIQKKMQCMPKNTLDQSVLKKDDPKDMKTIASDGLKAPTSNLLMEDVVDKKQNVL